MMRFRLWLFVPFLLWAVSFQTLRADDGARSTRLLHLMQAGRGDSLYAALDSTCRARLTPTFLSGLYAQLTGRMGALRTAGPWQVMRSGRLTVEQSRLDFERGAVQLRFVFDDEGRVAGMFMLPVVQAETPSPQPADSAAWEEREVSVVNGEVVLPATCCFPRGAGRRVPLVVFVHGSGPNDRDETLGPNHLFRDLAHHLAEGGVASLRYDKRTRVYADRFMEVSGRADYDTETVDDAVAALRLARTLPEVAPDSLYVVGHSLGATLAPRIAALSRPAPAGIVLLAALARPFEVALRDQLAYLACLQGLDSVRVEDEVAKALATLPAEYLDFARRYDPVATAAGLTLPLLVVQGGHDYQVTEADFRLWQQGLAGHANVRFAFLPALDHLMRPLPAMATPADYARYVPVSPEAVELLLRFLHGGK